MYMTEPWAILTITLIGTTLMFFEDVIDGGPDGRRHGGRGCDHYADDM